MVKTVSGSVASWPATGNVTTRPLPVLDLEQHAGGEGEDGEEGEAALLWQPNPESYQDQYKVSGSYCVLCRKMRGGDSGFFSLPCLSNRCTYIRGNDGPGGPEKKKGCKKMIEERTVPPAGGTLPVSLSQQITARSEFESGCGGERCIRHLCQ